ncbi:HD domain-containing protein [Niastella caeni]|uniref:HD domain-containing protein n=1 Tax=Niastella caeni TaxID=2569763 RepID=A0A4S8I4L6_9BACT|nr:Pycsar system effector family protein [Niastella caeni]THU41632.1 HD domain-containing protein [Niastella caeni]
MSTYNALLIDTESYVKGLFKQHDHANLVFHNLEHTESVVEHIHEIASQYEIPDKDLLELSIAGWFHDTGHLFTDPADHEEKSVALMDEFIRTKTDDEELINTIAALIRITKFPPTPQSLPEMIICDADTYHFGLEDFKQTNKAMKKELILRNMNTMVMDWEKNSLELLGKHQYFTSYCINKLQKGKEKNIRRLNKKVNKLEGMNVSETLLLPGLEKDESNKRKNSLVSRGIQTMLRLTSENHVELSNMADGKASILISVNAIIISVILSVLIRRIEVETHLTIPTFIFLASSLTTIIIAIMATRPKVSQGNFSREDILNKNTNLLFFGNFYKTKVNEYQWAMNTMMRDPDYLYSSLIMDIHQLGVVLARKYKLIRLAYTVFMIGLLVSVIAFMVAIMVHQPQQPVINSSSVSPYS